MNLCCRSSSKLSLVKDTHVARLHVSLAKSLLQCAGLDVVSSTERTEIFESQRKLYWSVFILDQLFGMPTRIPSLGDDLQTPRYLDISGMSQKTTIQCQLLPLESYDEMNGKAIGVWSYMIQQLYVWSYVRSYVWSCANGHNKSPWAADSEYTMINACLLDSECKLPSFVRYGTSKLSERSKSELQANKLFWLPWLCIQVIYHTHHSVLNHPFLYSQKQSQHRQGPNIFWKQSAEIAMLHCRWVTHIITLTIDNDLTVSDPFFAYAAAIAATLHFYYSRTSDPEASSTALDNLQTCRSFIADMARRWPICQSIVSISYPLATNSSMWNNELSVSFRARPWTSS